ncbi:hypothetical protein DH2020_034473 [Rehmannia glutinosa]|uniref:Chlorophyll a-b binding protein, chloroplastic n=1 Tax=Rehmannia glutinosa TaxID=99300 RepID=A0ABR0V991_REHGL
MALAIAAAAFSSFPTCRELPGKSLLPGKIATWLPKRGVLNATKGPSSICQPLPPDRPLWFPGSSPPQWLDGSKSGRGDSSHIIILRSNFRLDSVVRSSDDKSKAATDFPTGAWGDLKHIKRSDPELLKWFAQAELMHSRWAMLAVAGILIPEWLESLGFIENFSWYDAGAREYFADPTTLFVVQLALMGWAEGRRWADIINPGCVDIEPTLPHKTKPKPDVGYPGGLWFDPFMWGRGSPEPVMVLRTKEIKNGRLAMLAFVGFCFQAVYTGQGPIENLMAHIADPGHCNIFSAFTSHQV